MSWAKIMECVPNFSEGRDLQKIDQIVSPFRAKAGVKLLDYSNDEDHNRLVVTVVGEPEALKEAVIEASGVVGQTGQHLGGVIHHVFHLPHAPQEVAAHCIFAVHMEAAGLQQLIHIQTVRLGRGHAARRHMGLIQVTQLLQVAHLIADGGGG